MVSDLRPSAPRMCDGTVGAQTGCDTLSVRSPSMRSDAERVLRALVGRDDAVLRDDQWAAVEALAAERRRVFVVQRTGWGKSAVYFVATALLRAQGAGPTLIVSPLLALMRNQVDAAAHAGITAHTINSSNTEECAGRTGAGHVVGGRPADQPGAARPTRT